MGTRLKNRALDFLFQCLSLGSSLARVVTLSIVIGVLASVYLSSIGFLDFCIWEKLFGYCPAKGTTRSLNALFHRKLEEAIRNNLNILVVIPVITGILVADILRLIKTWILLRKPQLKH